MLLAHNPLDFEAWIVTAIPGLTPNERNVGDRGIDGRGAMMHPPKGEDSRLVIAQGQDRVHLFVEWAAEKFDAEREIWRDGLADLRLKALRMVGYEPPPNPVLDETLLGAQREGDQIRAAQLAASKAPTDEPAPRAGRIAAAAGSDERTCPSGRASARADTGRWNSND